MEMETLCGTIFTLVVLVIIMVWVNGDLRKKDKKDREK